MGGRDEPRQCIFCFKPATSDEHLLPEWLERLLPTKEPATYTREIEGDEAREWT